MIKFYCPHCKQKLSIERSCDDEKVTCPSCSEKICIPSSSTPESSVETNEKLTMSKARQTVTSNIRLKGNKQSNQKKKKGSLAFPSIFIAISLALGIIFYINKTPDKLAESTIEGKDEIQSVSKTESLELQTSNKPLLTEVPANDQLLKHVKPFIKKHCISCHNPDKEKGGVLLDELNYSLVDHSSVYIWQDVLEVLNGGEMPPEDEKQPDVEELKTAIADITSFLEKSKKRLAATGGVIKMRHLNKQEYFATIKDLFGLEPPKDFLYDDLAPDFDTIGTDQFFTSDSLENYLEIGEKIVKANLISYTRSPDKSKTNRFDPEKNLNKSMEKLLKESLALKKKIDSGASFKDLGFRDEGKLKLETRRVGDRIKRAQAHLARPENKFGYSDSFKYSLGRLKSGMTYKLNVSAVSSINVKRPVQVRVEVSPINFGVVTLKPDGDNKHVIELPFQTGMYDKKFSAKFDLLNKEDGYIDYVEFKGPYPTESSFAENIFKPLLIGKTTDAKVAEAIKIFSKRAFRFQDGNDEFIDAVIERYKQGQNNSVEGRIESLSKALSLILASPSFLYIAEKNNGNRQILSQKDFAVRLAYFLWKSPPDEELYRLAQNGRLFDAQVLKEQFERMLNSSKAIESLNSFINQWADIRRFDEVDLPKELQGEFQQSARAELSQFFKVLVRENLSVDKLIASEFAVINKTLAQYYGLTKEAETLDQNFQKVPLTLSANRGGMLSQAAFLITGTSGERTSPTIRGTIIRNILLNDPPPEPPANVPEIEEAKEGAVSVKELVEHHKSLPQCSSCHDKIDPIGLGLENFDRYGQWREQETLRIGRKRGKKTKYKQMPLNTTGYLSKSEKFNDFRGLQKVLLENKQKLAESLYSSLLSYGIGRRIEFVDDKDIQLNLEILAKDNFRTRDMLFKVISSQTFRMK